jgi:hypothetical protein
VDVLCLFLQAFESIKEFIDYAKESDDVTILAGGNCDKRLNNNFVCLITEPPCMWLSSSGHSRRYEIV